MDIISHILIGRIISLKNEKKVRSWAMFFSFLPDVTQIPFFIYLGYINSRLFFYPKIIDWQGARELYPILTIIYEIPHSFFFLIFIILPIVIFLKLPKISIFAYFLHLFVDVFTHAKGEWVMKPFFPFNFSINGFCDVWVWPMYLIFLFWAVFLTIIICYDKFVNKNRRSA